MKQLIKLSQKVLIECDGISCDYKVKNETGEMPGNLKEYINRPCPECGTNLCTQSDYNVMVRFVKIINWMNKWFSWLAPDTDQNPIEKSVSLKIENGKIKKN